MDRWFFSLRMVGNEIKKRLLILWDYKFDALMQLLIFGLIFVGATFFLGKGHFNLELLSVQFVGYTMWMYGRAAMRTMSEDLSDEAQAGTLEQMYMAPVAPELLLLGRLLALFLWTSLMVLLMAGLLITVFHIVLPFRWEELPILLCMFCELFGLALLLSGLGLVFKQISTFADLLQQLFLFLTGSLVPISIFPNWLAVLARTLPTTQGILALQAVLFDHQSLVTLWTTGDLSLLCLHAFLYLGGGIATFRICTRYAKHQGLLGQY
ncbi:ABC transporter permease [Ktedonospora formicarum]|uniref:ABC-2 type transporter transmembrane domain-containing protein n=1 Tax=Ktedonospora formicarum TaxID=2778364 RepID=A0A8J3I9S3_9CHLR|nr:ABC transporter permease [Ktedonospora formicarum]GHO47289.1 hypothetical protein KSX_54520 [Ktedonospora formicarum]